MKSLICRLIIDPRTRAYLILALVTTICLSISLFHTNLAMRTLAVEVDTDNSTARLGYVEHTLSQEKNHLQRTVADWATNTELFDAVFDKVDQMKINTVFKTNTMSILDINAMAVITKNNEIITSIRDDIISQIEIKIDPSSPNGVAIVHNKLYIVAIERIGNDHRNVVSNSYLVFVKESCLNDVDSIVVIKPSGIIPSNMSSIIDLKGDIVHGHMRLTGLGNIEIAEIKTTVRTPLWVSTDPQKYLIMIVNTILFSLTLLSTYMTLASIRSHHPKPINTEIANRIVKFMVRSPN